MGGTATASGSAKTGKVNDVVEDANWRQRINAETEAAECWRHEWGFLLSQNGADAGLDNSFTERARAKMKEMEAVQAARDEEMDASAAAEKANELFLKTFKKKHKAFPKCVHRVSQRAHSHVIFSLSTTTTIFDLRVLCRGGKYRCRGDNIYGQSPHIRASDSSAHYVFSFDETYAEETRNSFISSIQTANTYVCMLSHD